MKETPGKLTSFISSKFRWKAFFGFAFGAAVAVTALGINVQRKVIYRVYVNDTTLGYIKNLEEYDKVKTIISETDGTEPLQHIKLVASNEYWRKTSEGVKEENQQVIARGEQTEKDEKAAESKTMFQALGSTRIGIYPSSHETSEEEYTYNEYLAAKEEMEYDILTAVSYDEEPIEEGQIALQSMATASSEQVKHTEDGYVTAAWIEDYTRKALNLRVYAVALYSGNEQIAVLQSQQDADTVMEQVKKRYYPQSGKCTILSCDIKENISTSSIMAYREEIMDTYDTVQKIVDGKGVKKVYEVQKGDTLWGIALRNGVSIEELQLANEGIDINNIHIGDDINLSVIEPYVTVTVVADVTSKEVISYETKKVTDKSLKAGTTVVKQEGQNGVAEVQAKVTLINGNVVTEDVLNRTVLSEPVARVVNVGTYYVASGTYIRPTGGMISSRYGYRHGEFHTGVDFASSRGTPIRVSNSGKVISAGWNGNYGLCVIVDHGNGVQTLYGHCSKLYVSVGQYVSKGNTIAAVGSTGRSTGPHVHFEVRIRGKYTNPFHYIN
jgi:murein DD-endopeptidase MepM/ murein hydrolase activator NlpD